MKNQTTQEDDNYIKIKEEVTEKTYTGDSKRKPIKVGIDPFVFALVLLFLLIDLIVISNEPLIEGSTTLSLITNHTTTLFIMLLVNRVKKDPQYSYAYFFLGVLLSLIMEIITSMMLSNYLSSLNLYTETVVNGVLRAFIWGYFYRSFKIYSMKKLFE